MTRPIVQLTGAVGARPTALRVVIVSPTRSRGHGARKLVVSAISTSSAVEGRCASSERSRVSSGWRIGYCAPFDTDDGEEADVDSEEFVRVVTERSGLDRGQAQAAVRSTLQVLADAVSVEQAHQLAGELPEPLRDAITDRTARRDGADAEALGLDDFRARVAERAGLSPTGIDDAIAAVLAALEQAAPGEFAKTMEQLPDDFRALLGEDPPAAGR